MRNGIIFPISGFAVLLGVILHSEEKDASVAPRRSLEVYFKSLKEGDIDNAKEFTAKFAKIPLEALDQLTTKFSQGAQAGKLAMKIVPKSIKVIEDCAVVTFEDGNKDRPDYDPAYLIKQDGDWKVFLKLTAWKNPAFEITDEQKERFTELEQWFKMEKERLERLREH